MTINMKKMQARKKVLDNGNGDSSRFWRPSEGAQTIRILSPKDGDPFRDYWFHYNVGENTPGFLSPKRNFGEACPLDSFVRQLWKEGTDESKRMAKRLGARQRFFAPVIVRGEESEGVKVWGFGKRAYETLLGLVLNPEYGDITDPESGLDLDLEYSKPAGGSFPETKLTPKRKSTKLHEDPDRVLEFLENIPDFDELFKPSRRTSEEVQEILDRFLDSEDASADVSSSGPSAVERAFTELGVA